MEHRFMDKKLKSKLIKIIKENFESNRRVIPWDGMHDITANQIEKLLEENENKA